MARSEQHDQPTYVRAISQVGSSRVRQSMTASATPSGHQRQQDQQRPVPAQRQPDPAAGPGRREHATSRAGPGGRRWRSTSPWAPLRLHAPSNRGASVPSAAGAASDSSPGPRTRRRPDPPRRRRRRALGLGLGHPLDDPRHQHAGAAATAAPRTPPCRGSPPSPWPRTLATIVPRGGGFEARAGGPVEPRPVGSARRARARDRVERASSAGAPGTARTGAPPGGPAGRGRSPGPGRHAEVTG